MTHRTLWTLGTTVATLAVLVALLGSSVKGQAARDNTKDDENESRIRRGLDIAPVPLKIEGKNRALVGLGSYLVNAAGDCNGCHAGLAGQYAAGGNPFFGEPAVVNPAAYLAGGSPLFGPVLLPRNLTPDKTGRPEGGASYEEFLGILRTGVDPDQAHLQFGPLLQVMPWPTFHNMTDHDIRAVYEYLSTIPCLEGDPGLPNPRPIGTRCR